MIFNCDFFCNMSRVNSCKLFLCQFRVKVPMGTGIGGVDRKGGEEWGSYSGTEVWHFITCRESTIHPMKE